MTKIDLDDLERKARDSASEDGGWYSDPSSDWNIDPDEMPRARGHIAANSPPVTLALVARIRELEELALISMEAVEMMAKLVTKEDAICDHGRAILEKGAVLP